MSYNLENQFFLMLNACLVTLIIFLIFSTDNENINVKKFIEKSKREPPICDESDGNLIRHQCHDRPLHFRFEQRGKFWVMVNYIKAEKTFRCHESITLTANADFLFLDNLIPAIEKWKGPISIGVYAPGNDFYNALDSIAYLRNCQTDLIKKYVTFHIFFNIGHNPKMINNVPLRYAYKDKFPCIYDPPFKTMKSNETYRAKKNLTYPINVARNIAIEAVQTHFIFPLDIELYPSPFFIKKFLKMINKNIKYMNKKLVYVLPHFEIKETAAVPDTKKELAKLFKKHTAFVFHEKLCKECHKLPRTEAWLKAKENNYLSIFSTFKRERPNNSELEPFFVSTIREPLFDERFYWEGAGDKMPQNFNLCLMGYDYAILDNAYLIHKPGVKKSTIQQKIYRVHVNSSNYLRKNIVQNELITFYGNRKKCLNITH